MWKDLLLLGYRQHNQNTTLAFFKLKVVSSSFIIYLVKHTTWRHLFLLAYGVIPGKLNSLVCLNTCHTQELHTLHTVTCCLCVVIAAHTDLWGANNNEETEEEKIKEEEEKKKCHTGNDKNMLLQDKRLRIWKLNNQPGCFFPQCCLVPRQSPWQKNYPIHPFPSIPVCILDIGWHLLKWETSFPIRCVSSQLLM